MRIIIETTEAESRFTTVSHEVVGQQMAGQPAPQEPHPLDGGPPAEALLLALGAKTEMRTTGVAGPGRATDAGKPPSWLLNITGGRPN